jgi:uncharacterized protein GlcG (DUF336 family)
LAALEGAGTALRLPFDVSNPQVYSLAPIGTKLGTQTPGVVMSLSAVHIEALLSAARAEATRQGTPPVNISVCDPSGHLAGFLRMDRALLDTIDVAHRKARTAALFETDSASLGGVAHPDGPSYMVEHTNGGLINFGGGVVLRGADGSVFGAVGVSGASVEQDEAIAQAAVARFKKEHLNDAA